MWAIVKGHDQIVTSLLEAGADVHMRSKVRFQAVACLGNNSFYQMKINMWLVAGMMLFCLIVRSGGEHSFDGGSAVRKGSCGEAAEILDIEGRW
jgi:hypothetical protein